VAVLKEKAAWLQDRPEVDVLIEGHCDERGTNEYNLALGERRAQSAKVFLVNMGIASSRLTTVSYGEERPLDPGHDEAAWAKNRRAQFVIE
jgi:peptidoglycan-associated lipoprotein